ncbi:hypothetical protein ACIRQF_29215 [Streptomyces sp. NPDC101191]|uniref:hypothetical protein n=1 Tax=Streptomyces sp. NPDC101191 TaxID=3366126 RepID=UPI0038244553
MSSTGANAEAHEGASAGALHRLVVFGDVVGSGRLGMDEKRLTRAAMYEAFGEAYASVGIEPGTVHQEDRGDGILAALRPDVPPALMVGRWIDTLHESLRVHNAGRRGRLRMRVGMNAGLVLDDGRGLVGRAVDLACRLCDSAPAKRVMADAPEVDLLIVVSDWLYRNVVVEGGRYIEPDRYRRAAVVSKETDEDAWFHVPGLPEPPTAPGAARPGGPERRGGDPRTGGGPSRGDGSPPRAPAGNRSYTAGRDIQVIEGNTFHGRFTGIRNGPASEEPDTPGSGHGADPLGGDDETEVPA